MLKKVGIVTATVTAGLLAVSPLAFAGGDHDGGWGHGHGHGGHGGDQTNLSDSSRNSSQNGLVNVGDVNALNNAAVCPPVNANVAAGLLGVLAPAPATAAQEGSGAAASCSPGDSLSQLNNR